MPLASVITVSLLIAIVKSTGNQEWTVNISSSASNDFHYYWNECVGSGHGSLLLREDWRQYMEDAHIAINFSYVRAHGILDDDVGSVNGINDYSFVNIDKIYSYLLSIGMKPYVEISFMPAALAKNASETLDHYKLITSPPKSYDTWHDFIKAWVQHLVDYFGANEVRSWYFEVWNEPNNAFFSGGYSDYIQLYNATATAIKSVDSKLRVGGPTTSMNFIWFDQFLNWTLTQKIPIDFVVGHSYPNVNKMNKSTVTINTWPQEIQTAAIDIVNKYNKEFNIELPLIISEYNSGLGVSHSNQDDNFSPSFHIFWAKHLQTLFKDSTLQFLSWWAISDVFEEGGFNSNEFANGYGIQTIRGTKKPSYRSFELLQKFGSEIEYESKLVNDNNGFANVSMSTAQVYCLKNKNDKGRYGLFVANWNNYEFDISDQRLTINVGNYIENSGNVKSAIMYRIDSNNTSPLSEWKSMASPEYPTMDQLNALNKSSQFIGVNVETKKLDDNTLQILLDIPVYGVAVIDLQY